MPTSPVGGSAPSGRSGTRHVRDGRARMRLGLLDEQHRRRRESRRPRGGGSDRREGDEGHLQFARDACAVNGFAPTQVTFITASLQHPRDRRSSRDRRQRARSGAGARVRCNDEERAAALASGRFDELPIISLEDSRWTLPARPPACGHPGRRGRPPRVVRPLLDAHVAYLVIGTHSREIEGRLVRICSHAHAASRSSVRRSWPWARRPRRRRSTASRAGAISR